MYSAKKTANDYKNCSHSAAEAFEEAGKRVRDTFHNASDSLCSATGTAKDHIRQHPVRSTLIALGAGYVLSKLLNHR